MAHLTIRSTSVQAGKGIMNLKVRLCCFLLSGPFSLSTTEGFQISRNLALANSQRVSQKSSRRHSRGSLGATVESVAGIASRDVTLDWSFLDGVYLITCPNADLGGKRLLKAKEVLEEVGLLDKLQVKEFDTDDDNRIRGCYTSHISVLADVLQSSRNEGEKKLFENFFGNLMPKSSSSGRQEPDRDLNVLVLEDNIALSTGQLKQSLIDSVAEYIAENKEWDMIHLSYIPYVPNLRLTKTDSKDIVKLSCGVGSALGTTAYIINTKGIKRLLQDHEDSNGFYAPIPDVMAKLFPESRYATNPTIFVRAPNTKSLVNPQLDDLRSLLFQPSVVVLAQQLLIATSMTTNVLLPITVVFLFCLSALSLLTTFDSLWMMFTTGDLGRPVLLPLLSGAFSLFSLGILAKGAMLAPRQENV